MIPELDASLRSGFLRSSERFPDRIALEVAGERLTYAELRARAAALASTLITHDRTRAGSKGPEGAPLTAVFGHRSVATFAGILGDPVSR